MKTLCICSGGIDSISLLGKCIAEKNQITAITFDYGQKAKKEMEVVKKLSEKYGFEVIEVDISFMKKLYGNSNQLTSDSEDVKDDYEKNIIVPLRNGVFSMLSMAYGYANGFDKITLGCHLNDTEEKEFERLFPDCSVEFIKTLELAGKFGTLKSDKKIEIVSWSTLNKTKSELIKIGFEYLGDFIFETWSCYKNDEKQCGVCDSCKNRKAAFKNSDIEDKTEYEK